MDFGFKVGMGVLVTGLQAIVTVKTRTPKQVYISENPFNDLIRMSNVLVELLVEKPRLLSSMT